MKIIDRYCLNTMTKNELLVKEAIITFWKKYDGYIRLSIQKYAEPFQKQLYDKVIEKEARYREIVADGDENEEWAINYKELLDGNIMGLGRLQHRVEMGEFVDDSLCVDGRWVDMELYYNDLIMGNNEKLLGMKILLKQKPNIIIEEKIEKLLRINTAMQRKIDTNRLEQPVMKLDMKKSEVRVLKNNILKNKAIGIAGEIAALNNADK